MKRQRFALAFALAALLGSAAEAQQRPDRAEMFKRFDKNGDGQLDESERKQAREDRQRGFAAPDNPAAGNGPKPAVGM